MLKIAEILKFLGTFKVGVKRMESPAWCMRNNLILNDFSATDYTYKNSTRQDRKSCIKKSEPRKAPVY